MVNDTISHRKKGHSGHQKTGRVLICLMRLLYWKKFYQTNWTPFANLAIPYSYDSRSHHFPSEIPGCGRAQLPPAVNAQFYCETGEVSDPSAASSRNWKIHLGSKGRRSGGCDLGVGGLLEIPFSGGFHAGDSHILLCVGVAIVSDMFMCK